MYCVIAPLFGLRSSHVCELKYAMFFESLLITQRAVDKKKTASELHRAKRIQHLVWHLVVSGTESMGSYSYNMYPTSKVKGAFLDLSTKCNKNHSMNPACSQSTRDYWLSFRKLFNVVTMKINHF
jgi:hypothetical protein